MQQSAELGVCMHRYCAEALETVVFRSTVQPTCVQPTAQDILRRYSEVLSTEYNGRICAKLVRRASFTNRCRLR